MISGKVRRDHHTGALLRAALLAVVLVVFVMHALTSHQHVHGGHATAFALVDAGDRAQHAHSDVAPGDAATTLDSPDGDPPCDHGGVGESCLALLCIVALLAFVLRRRGSSRVLYVLRRWAAPARPWTSRTGDPPCLHQLSILRC